MPKGTAEEKEERTTRIQRALRVATETPLDVMRACVSAIDQADVVASYGNQNASSDVRVALELLMAGLRGAKYNVEINLGSVKDQAYVDDVREETETLLARSNTNLRRDTATRFTDHELMDLLEEPLPARAGEEVRHDREHPLDRRTQAVVDIIVAA